MDRLTITINLDNHPELYEFVNSKGNRSEFIRDLISQEMYQEKIRKGSEIDLEHTIEKVVKRCLQEYNPILEVKKNESKTLIEVEAAANFFDED